MQTIIFCKTQFEGMHCYPKAPREVAFLKVPHRHMFGIEVGLEVFNDDREVEFIMLKRNVEVFLNKHFDRCYTGMCADLGTMSCEQIAKEIIGYLEECYCKETKRTITVTVDEDGENGATVTNDGEFGSNSMSDGFNHYQKASYKNVQEHDNVKDAIMQWTIGLTEEAGEVASLVKHKYCHNEDIPVEKFIEECGDVLWYLSALSCVLGVPFAMVADTNISKLDKRFKNGYSDEAVKERHNKECGGCKK